MAYPYNWLILIDPSKIFILPENNFSLVFGFFFKKIMKFFYVKNLFFSLKTTILKIFIYFLKIFVENLLTIEKHRVQ